MTEHSKLPWRTEFNDIYSADDKCLMAGIRESNAAFVVRAVNAHYDMLEALEEIASNIDFYIDAKYSPLKKEIMAARTAIAKAKGGA